MNNKTRKLGEAKYFYDRMVEVQKTEIQHNREYFTYNFSAFLSASRSVLQYMCDEIKRKMEPTAKQEAKTWYEEKMVASPVLRFFKGNRDINIHSTPIMPIGHIVAIGSSSVSFRYSFSARPEPDKEVLHLCEIYLDELEKFINEGLSKGHITK
ncbi:MAG: hypothetical protein IMZ57_09225 [Acidobacteria bacterium]|nr:hypothetical protein [Acidobacteriota bacterium]